MRMSTSRRASLSEEAANQLRLRCALELKHRVEQRFREQVAHWATQESGEFPTREQAQADMEDELQILLHGLGELALLTPDDIFPSHPW